MIRIVSSTSDDVSLLSESMREEDASEALKLGRDPIKLLWRSFRSSLIRRSAFVDSEIAAMWGVSGTPLGSVGCPWLVTTKACERISPITFARVYRKEVNEMLRIFPVLENYVDNSYNSAVKLLAITGFFLHPPEPIGINGPLFRKFEMRA